MPTTSSTVRHPRWPLISLTAAALVAGVLAGSRTDAQDRSRTVRLPGHVPHPTIFTRRLGAVAAAEPVELALTLPLRRTAELNALLARLYDPGDPQYHHFLTTPEFVERFAPTPAQYEAVAQFARERGLTITQAHGNRLLLDVAGPAAVVERAFSTRLSRFQDAGGRVFRAPEAEPAIPAYLAGTLSGVVGLDDLGRRRPHLRRRDGAAGARVQSRAQTPGTGPGGGLAPSDIRAAYKLAGTSLNGTGQTLALFELDGYLSTDISTYEDTFGLAHVPLQNILMDGVSGAAGSGSDEVTLDIELQIALAPNAGKIMVYEGPNTNAGVLDTYNQIAVDNAAKAISTSWGLPETQSSSSAIQSEAAIFQQMAAQGQSMFAASGDQGAYDDGHHLTVDDPASQPYVTGVGGTMLSTNGAGGSWQGETTWNDGSPSKGGSGGGISTVWPLPSYQSGVVSGASQGSTTRRNVPDVALNAEPNTGYAIYSGGRWAVFGGTSCAAPLWSAFAALVNQQRAANGKGTAGFLNPQLYSLGKTKQAMDFHDVADGSTNLFYPAVTGYDDATGWGTFNGAALLADLAGAGAGAGTPPSLTNCSVTTRSLPASGGAITVSVEVTSSTGIASVSLVVTPPSGSATTTALTRTDSAQTYSGTVTLPANATAAIATYHLSLTARDTSGNTGSLDCGTVVVAAKDTTPPTFTACSVTPPALPSSGGTVTISARATDASGVASVTATVTGGGKTTTLTLSADALGTFSSTFVAPPNATGSAVSYTVTLRAADPYGNAATTTCGPLTVAAGDTTPPSIRSCSVSPKSLPSSGGAVTITAVVTDNVAVASVTATLVRGDGTTASVPLTVSSGTTYTATYTVPANTSAGVETWGVTLRAIDTSSNSAGARCGTLTVAVVVVDRTPPTISRCVLSPRSLTAAGGTVSVSATVTDDVAVASVSARVTRPDGTTVLVPLPRSSGSTYAATYSIPANATVRNQSYAFTLLASDAAGNTRTARCGTVTVRHR